MLIILVTFQLSEMLIFNEGNVRFEQLPPKLEQNLLFISIYVDAYFKTFSYYKCFFYSPAMTCVSISQAFL